MKVRKDDKGCYVVHGDCKVRPIATGQDSHLADLEGRTWSGDRRIIIRSKGFTEFVTGDVVTKYHFISTIRVRVRNSQCSEIWFIHEKDRIRERK